MTDVDYEDDLAT